MNDQYDLFISYARADNQQGRIAALVTEIERDLNRLLGRPVTSFFDAQEIRGMQDWRDRILQGLRDSRLLVTIISPAYLASEYCMWEFNEYLNHEAARGLAGNGVAPIYFVEIPGWEDKNYEQNCAGWVRDLRSRQYFDLRPFYRQGAEALNEPEVGTRWQHLGQRLSEHLRRGETIAAGLGNVDRHNPHFQGRAADLRRLHQVLHRGQLGMLAAVHGLGGMGKTALALEYAHVYRGEYGGGRWQVRCEGRKDIRLALASLAPDLGIQFTGPETADANLQFSRVLAELRRLSEAIAPHRCLVILDNVDDPALLEPAQTQRLPAADGLHLLVTTRLGEAELHGQATDREFLPVDELPEDEAVAVIESYQPGKKFGEEAEREAAREIVRLLGGLTLAVEGAAVFLGEFAGEVTCRGFLERLKQKGLTGLEAAASETPTGVPHGEKQLEATLAPTWERLSPPEKRALQIAALLPADQISLPWLRVIVAQEFPEIGLEAEPGHPDPWQAVVRRLLGLRLLKPAETVEAGGVLRLARIHRLVQEVIRRDWGEGVDELRSAVSKVAKERCVFLEQHWLNWNNRWEIEPLRSLALLWLEHNFPDASYIANEVAIRLEDQARYLDSEPLKRGALAIDEKRFGPEHPKVAAYLNNLAHLLRATNRLREAEPLMRRALAIDEQSYGPEHPKVAIRLNNLAALLQDTNRLGEAEPLMRRALAIDEQRYGLVHPNVAIRLNNLAQLLQATNRPGEAEPLMRRALAVDEQSYGLEHPHVAIRLNNLATLLYETNRLGEAEPLMRRALAIDEQSYGPEHPHVAIWLNNLAWLLQATNRLGEAEPLMRRHLEIFFNFTEQTGHEHPNLQAAIRNYTGLLSEMGKDPAAIMAELNQLGDPFGISFGDQE